MKVHFCFFVASLLIGPGGEVDVISRQRGILTQCWAGASVRLKTLGVLGRYFIPSHTSDDVQKTMKIFGILLASKRDAQVQSADRSPKTERDVLDAILVVGVGEDVSCNAGSPHGTHDGPAPRMEMVHKRGAEVNEHRRQLDETSSLCLHGSSPGKNENVPVSTVSTSYALNLHAQVRYEEFNTGSPTPLIADEILQEF